jgi:hypothetical protein
MSTERSSVAAGVLKPKRTADLVILIERGDKAVDQSRRLFNEAYRRRFPSR